MADQIESVQSGGQVAGAAELAIQEEPVFSGDAVDVVLTAEAALAWDEKTGKVLYEKNAHQERPVASLSKLLTALVVRDELAVEEYVTIAPEARAAQLKGVDIGLPIGHTATVKDLLAAGLVASANDAMVTLAVAVADSEEAFAGIATSFALEHGLQHTKISNATGLEGGSQYSTANDIRHLFSMAYDDPVLRNMMVTEKGTVRTAEGQTRWYTSTNELLGTYFPVLAAKTGYTREAGENLVVMTFGEEGQRVGAVVLGSSARFHDMKVLIEWIWRNYSWP